MMIKKNAATGLGLTPPTRIDAAWPCLRLDVQGKNQRVILDLSISPNAKRTELVGWHDGALRIRLAAPPVDGAANEALRRWLSDQVGLPLAGVTLLRGASGRRKQWALDTAEKTVTSWLIEQVRAGKLTSPTL